jgi:hypothetical protein
MVWNRFHRPVPADRHGGGRALTSGADGDIGGSCVVGLATDPMTR